MNLKDNAPMLAVKQADRRKSVSPKSAEGEESLFLCLPHGAAAVCHTNRKQSTTYDSCEQLKVCCMLSLLTTR